MSEETPPPPPSPKPITMELLKHALKGALTDGLETIATMSLTSKAPIEVLNVGRGRDSDWIYPQLEALKVIKTSSSESEGQSTWELTPAGKALQRAPEIINRELRRPIEKRLCALAEQAFEKTYMSGRELPDGVTPTTTEARWSGGQGIVLRLCVEEDPEQVHHIVVNHLMSFEYMSQVGPALVRRVARKALERKFGPPDGAKADVKFHQDLKPLNKATVDTLTAGMRFSLLFPSSLTPSMFTFTESLELSMELVSTAGHPIFTSMMPTQDALVTLLDDIGRVAKPRAPYKSSVNLEPGRPMGVSLILTAATAIISSPPLHVDLDKRVILTSTQVLHWETPTTPASIVALAQNFGASAWYQWHDDGWYLTVTDGVPTGLLHVTGPGTKTRSISYKPSMFSFDGGIISNLNMEELEQSDSKTFDKTESDPVPHPSGDVLKKLTTLGAFGDDALQQLPSAEELKTPFLIPGLNIIAEEDEYFWARQGASTYMLLSKFLCLKWAQTWRALSSRKLPRPPPPSTSSITVGLLGWSDVGKTTWVSRSVPAEFERRRFPLHGFVEYPLAIHSTPPIQEVVFNALDPQSCNSPLEPILSASHGVLVFFDVTSRVSFHAVRHYIEVVTNCAGEDVPIVVVATKIDAADRKVLPRHVEDASWRSSVAGYVEVCSKANVNWAAPLEVLHRAVLPDAEPFKCSVASLALRPTIK